MESSNLQRRYIDFTSTLFREGFLDSQYTQLQQLQDESNPDFVTEVVTLFFQDSEKLQDELSRTLDQEVVDFKKVAAHVHQLKGSSASIGAQRVKNVCMAFRICCEEMNREGSACDLSKYMILVLGRHRVHRRTRLVAGASDVCSKCGRSISW
ncbi:histidine-containing phosphotransfer protein 1-like isoform X1 [Musa acuminata AAA Group]|uniref:histidine-containing phosphotransfer protein 1-like isoform X1 n=1 Tax=Musa acuminata AAA Group TaxID=214697 RepID=UPI0031DD78FE